MKFSVIIPVYNSAPFLHKCIDSIIKQQYEDYELILIDDGSSDSSYNICIEYAYNYSNIQAFRQENSGPSATRNHGIEKAKGDYILFVDSDDWVTGNYFSILADAVKHEPDIVFFGVIHPNDVDNPEKTYPELEIKGTANIVEFIAENYGKADTHSCINKAYARNLFQEKKLQFPEKTVVEEDLLFLLRVSMLAETAVAVSKVIYHYNQREYGSITTKYNPVKFDSKVTAFKEEEAFAKYWKNRKLETIFQDNYLSYVSSCITNLMYTECTLSRKEKIKEIKRFYREEATRECVKKATIYSTRSKVMKILIRGQMYRVSFFLHALIFRIMRQ